MLNIIYNKHIGVVCPGDNTLSDALSNILMQRGSHMAYAREGYHFISSAVITSSVSGTAHYTV